jgi:D-inositol-3-phosphate glycosyltransferase
MRVAIPHPPASNPYFPLGADLASRQLIRNFQRYARDIEFEIFAGVVAREGGAGGCSGRSQAGRSDDSPPSEPAVRGWDLLHDVRPTGDPRRHFYLRSATHTRFPILLTHHALSYPSYLDSFFAPLVLARSQPYDAVVCTSYAARDAFKSLLGICAESLALFAGGPLRFGGQLRVIPLGVDTDLFRPRDKGDVRHQLQLPPNAFVLLWVGRLSPGTKADLIPLLRAYRRLRERNPDRETLLVLVGPDPEDYARTLETYAVSSGLGSSFRLERPTPRDPIHLWHSAADVFVSPVDNVQETFGVAAIEAMASGVPQVVSDWDGHRDTVVHGKTGFRIPTFWAPCDAEAVARWALWGDVLGSQALLAQTVACDLGDLVRYLELLLRSPELCATMSETSRARAIAEFGWPVIVQRYAQCWRELVESSNGFAPPTPKPMGILPAFFRAFSSYPSCVLSGESRVRISVEARTEDSQAPLYHGIRPNNARGLDVVFSTLAARGGEMTLDALSAVLAANEYDASEVLRLVLVGVKYGLLDVGSDEHPAPPSTMPRPFSGWT